MLKESISLIQPCPTGQSTVVVDHFVNKFLINYAQETNSGFILRGIRNIHDFEFEKTIRTVNADLIGHDRITTVFLIPPRELGELSSSFVKGLCGPEHWQPVVEKLVPPPVYQDSSHSNHIIFKRSNLASSPPSSRRLRVGYFFEGPRNV